MTNEPEKNEVPAVKRPSLRAEILAMELAAWFAWTGQTDYRRAHRWSADPIGAVIKGRLKELGHWRNRPRGNPAKGLQVMQDNRKNRKPNQ